MSESSVLIEWKPFIFQLTSNLAEMFFFYLKKEILRVFMHSIIINTGQFTSTCGNQAG